MHRVRMWMGLFLALAVATASARADKEEGFVPLFDGKSLSGWTGDVKGYMVEDGAIVCKGGNLYTEREFGDFVLRLEFKLPPGGNNGVGIRTPLKGHAASAGMEIQVLDDESPKYATIKPWQFCGSIYGVVAAKRGHLKPANEWNDMEITCKGTQVTVKLNGHVVADADVAQYAEKGAADGKKHPSLTRTSGHVLFCGHGSPVAFRNIRVKELGSGKAAK